MIRKVAVMGTGSLGTILGAYLARGGIDVTLVDADRAHVDALNASGAHVTGEIEMTVTVKACIPEEMDGTFDLFIYLAKQTYNDTAIPQMVSHCHENTIICTGQNGIPEYAVAEQWPAALICGATIGWGAAFVGPGVSKLTAKPGVPTFCMHLGTLTGEHAPWLEEVQSILETMCPVYLTENLIRDRWSKILINSTFSGMSTVVNGTFDDAFGTDHGLECVIRIGREVVRVCHAMQLTLPPIYGADFDRIYDFDDEAGEAAAKEAVLAFAGGGGGGSGKASMLQDLQKGRKCEIAYINGIVAQTGRKVGVETPYTDAVVRIVEEIQDGKRPLSPANVDDMPHLPV